LKNFLDKGKCVPILDNPVTIPELTKVVKSLKNNKSQGLDQISNEMLKHSCIILEKPILKLFNLVLKSEQFPSDWCYSTLITLYKSGDKFDPENYGGISLSSCLGKVFTKILNNRLTLFLDKNGIIPEYQIGFRKSYRTADHIFMMRTLIGIAKSKGQKIFACFIDLKKAFDTVWRDGLIYKLINSGINSKICLL